MVLWSRTMKQVVLLELTVPCEEGMEEAHERKLRKYQSLIHECQQEGWWAWNLPVEVGCRGFPGQSLWSALSRLGIRGPSRRRLVANITKRAEIEVAVAEALRALEQPTRQRVDTIEQWLWSPRYRGGCPRTLGLAIKLSGDVVG